MTQRLKHPAWLILFVVSCLAQAEDITLERLMWQEPVASGSTLVIHNHYGNIRVRQGTDDVVMYHAVAQNSPNHQAKLVTEQNDDGLTRLVIAYDTPPAEDALERVDLVVVVPKAISLDFEIERGDLSSKSLENAVKVRSKHSQVVLKTSQAVDVLSESGDINVFIKAHKQTNHSTLKSFSGDINVEYQTDLPPAVEAVAGSSVTTNDVRLLNNKKLKQRTQVFHQDKALDHLTISNDTGHIRLINIQK
jgi:hypothetical protein